ncbi:MAG: DUF3737 family protein [Coriobacteriales bacterium]|nr:DUF3737 family protein [Coriobacteriales bacterium]
MTNNNSTVCTTTICNKTFDEERALYGLAHATLEHVRFAGPADGESALKECQSIAVRDSSFELRYPMWHDDGVELERVELAQTTRAALWYTSNLRVSNSKLLGPKALRECDNVAIENSEIVSEEFGWQCRQVTLRGGSLAGDYAFLHSRDLRLENVDFRGKYSFQYVENLVIEGGVLDTKDAFWHSHNVTVRNATLKGEYLGWYSDGLTLINCRIEGTQPLVRCTNLTLVDCTMVDCDLAFEGSDVRATVRGRVDSIRDPKSGHIEVDSVGEIVHDTLMGCGAQIVVRKDSETLRSDDRDDASCPFPCLIATVRWQHTPRACHEERARTREIAAGSASK